MAIEWHGAAVTIAVQNAVEGGLFAGAEHILQASNKMVPHETGDLETSGIAQVEDTHAVVAYTEVYAARQHEETGWAHDPGRQAKYLETAVLAEGPTAIKLVAAKVRGAIGG